MVGALYIEVPGERPYEVRLEPDVVTVGRSEENTLGLRDMNVSRKHFLVERRPGIGYVLHDNGSRNGTVVNGVSVLDKLLVEGDRVEVGGSKITFRAVASPQSITVAEAPRPVVTKRSEVGPGPRSEIGFVPGAESTSADAARPQLRPPGSGPTLAPSGRGSPRAAGPPTQTGGPLAASVASSDLIAPSGHAPAPPPLAPAPARGYEPAPGMTRGYDPRFDPGVGTFVPQRGAASPPPGLVTPVARGFGATPGPAPFEGPPGFGHTPAPLGHTPAPIAPPAPTPSRPLAAVAPNTPPPPAEPGPTAVRARPPRPAPKPEVPAPAQAAAPAGAERWRKLAEVACAINLEREVDKLLERILDAVLSLVPSKGGFVVLCEGDRLVVSVNRNVKDVSLDGTGQHRLSEQICREAIAQRRPVLTQDAIGDERLGQFQTVMALRLKSILCVPFASQDEVLGVVYLDEPTVDPFADNGEVVDLVGAFGDLAGIALANARYMHDIGERERMAEELRIAARIQQKLVPQRAPAVRGLELAGRSEPARELGGDLFDFFRRERPEPGVIVAIGDVAGKGVGAGLVMSTVRALLRAYAEVHAPTDQLLVAMNRTLALDLEPGIFVSYLLMRYDETTGGLAFTGAGHEHLVVIRAGGDVETIRAGGVVMGLMADISKHVSERPLHLATGDVVVLYTDGATEAPDLQGDELGLEGVTKAILAGPLEPSAIVERVIAAVHAFTGFELEQHDDLTVVAMRKT